jgi:hypothetical protein
MLSGVLDWQFCAADCTWRSAGQRLRQGRWLRTRQRSQDLLGYLLPYTVPALICLPLTLYVSHFLLVPPSAGRWRCVSPMPPAAAYFPPRCCYVIVVVFNAGHKRRAAKIIRDYCPQAVVSDRLPRRPQRCTDQPADRPPTGRQSSLAVSRCSPGCLRLDHPSVCW